MAKSKLSENELTSFIEFGQGDPFGSLSSMIGTPIPNTHVWQMIEQNKYQSNLDMIDNILQDKTTGKTDTFEQVELDEDKVYRTYRLTKDASGKIIARALLNPEEGVKLEDVVSGKLENPVFAHQKKLDLFQRIRSSIDPATDEIREDVGKSFWDASFENSIMFQATRLGTQLANYISTGKWDTEIGRYGAGVFAGNEDEFAQLNRLSFKGDGVYYQDKKIAVDPKEINLIADYLGKRTNYQGDNFGSQFAGAFTTLMYDLPLFALSGGITSKALSVAIPGLTASTLPAQLVSNIARNTATLSLASTPSFITHSFEGGSQAFIDDLSHTAMFGIYAGAFSTLGNVASLGVSKLLQKQGHLQLSQAVNFLKRNPKMYQNLVGGFTSGMLGYTTVDGSNEDKLATALSFAALHFVNTDAFKSYLRGKSKEVVVEQDTYNDIYKKITDTKRDTSIGLMDAIRETQATSPRMYIREKNELREINGYRFSNFGEVEIINENPITLTAETASAYKYITETIPFAKKTFKQAINDSKLQEIKTRIKQEHFDKIANPYKKGTAEYNNFEYNKAVSSAQLANLIYTNDLIKELRANELPKDIKFEQTVANAANYFNLPYNVFERHIKQDLIKYAKNPEKFISEGSFRFLPEEYQKQFEKTLKDGLGTYQTLADKMEIQAALADNFPYDQIVYDKILDAHAKGVKTENLKGIIEAIKARQQQLDTPIEKKPYEKPATEINVKVQKPKEGELVDAQGRPLQGTKGAGLTAEERRRFNKPEEIIKVTQKEQDIVERLRTVADLNKALETSDNPRGLIKALTEYSKKESIKYEDTSKEQTEKQKETRLNRNQRQRERRKEKKQQAKTTEETRYKETVESVGGVYKGIQKDKAGQPSHVLVESPREATTRYIPLKEFTPERVSQEIQKIDTEMAEGRLNRDITELNKSIEARREELRKEGRTEEELGGLAFGENPDPQLKKMYDKYWELDVEKHKIKYDKIREQLNQGERKAVRLEDGTIVVVDAPSHLSESFAKAIGDKVNKVIDTGIVDAQGNFKSTMVVTPEQYRQAIRNIQAKGQNLASGIDPTLLKDYAIAGAHIFEKWGRSFGEWSKQMIRQFGEGIKNFLGRIWNEVSALLSGQKSFAGINIGNRSGTLNIVESAGTGLSGNTPKNEQKATAIERTGEGVIETMGKSESPKIRTEIGVNEKTFEISPRSTKEQKQFDQINNYLSRYKPKSVKGRLQGTALDPDTYENLHDIRTVAKMTEPEIEVSRERIGKDLSKLERQRVEEEVTQERYEELESDLMRSLYNVNTFGDLENKRGQILENNLNELKWLVEEGRDRFQSLEKARKEKAKTLREQAIKSFGDFQPLSETEARLQGIEADFEKSIGRKLSEAESAYLYGLGNIIQKISPKDYKTGKWVTENIKTAEGKEHEGMIRYENVLQSKLREIYGKEGKELLKSLEENKERVEKSGIFIKDKEFPISQNEAYKKWMEWQDVKYGRPTLQEMGFTEQTVQQIEKFLKPEVKRWAEWQLKEFYPEYHGTINEVFRRMYYADLTQHENYSPLKRAVNKIQQDELMKLATNPIASVANTSLIERVRSKAELQYVDGDQVLMSHIAQMEHFKAWAEPTRELRSVLQHSDIKTILRQRYGNKYNQLINDYINDLARGSILKEKVVPILDKLRNNFSGAVLSLPNLRIFPQQLSSFPLYATKIPTDAFIKGFGEMLKDPLGAYKILEQSHKFKARYKEGFDRDIKDYLSKKEVDKLAGVSSIKDTLMFMTKLGDKFAVVAGGYPVFKYHYDKAISKGLTPEQAREKALLKFDIATDELQQSAELVDLSSMQRGGSWAKLFTMFQSQPNLYYRATSMAVRDLIRGKGASEQHWKTIMLAHFALPMLFQFIADFGWDTKHQIRAGLLGSFNGIFAVGDIVQNLISAVQNDYAFEIQGTPVIDAPQQIFKAFEKIGEVSDSGVIATEDVLTIGDYLARGAAKFSGVPYEPTKRLVKGAGFEVTDEGIQHTGEATVSSIIGYGENVKAERKEALRQAKARMRRYKKLSGKNPDDVELENAYREAKREYNRIVRELKLKEKEK
jgi:hypothetical protein